MSFLKREVAHCDVCGHEWIVTANKVPIHCAKCKSRKWNTTAAVTAVEELIFKSGFNAGSKYICEHLTEQQVALLADAEWNGNKAGLIETAQESPDARTDNARKSGRVPPAVSRRKGNRGAVPLVPHAEGKTERLHPLHPVRSELADGGGPEPGSSFYPFYPKCPHGCFSPAACRNIRGGC